ncbi:hypothetical protein GGR50DRAFT_506714 [Xylaria sp. CBS 124048]|nr:hypothetical protein GGR50DRAFT_506714 [Xylaria sp. CBS 124048]
MTAQFTSNRGEASRIRLPPCGFFIPCGSEGLSGGRNVTLAREHFLELSALLLEPEAASPSVAIFASSVLSVSFACLLISKFTSCLVLPCDAPVVWPISSPQSAAAAAAAAAAAWSIASLPFGVGCDLGETSLSGLGIRFDLSDIFVDSRYFKCLRGDNKCWKICLPWLTLPQVEVGEGKPVSNSI